MFNKFILFPKEIKIEEYGIFVVYSDQTSGLIEWIIKMRTKGLVNHVMFSITPGWFVSQGNTYSEVEMDRYMKKGNRLYFFRLLGLTPEQEQAIRDSIKKKLALPWWRKLYDWIGISGQALGIKWVNIDGLNYCSEDNALHRRAVLPLIDIKDKNIYDFYRSVPLHEHPQGMFDEDMRNPEFMERYGYWEGTGKIIDMQPPPGPEPPPPPQVFAEPPASLDTISIPPTISS